MGKIVEFKVVGVSFVEGHPANLHRLLEHAERRKVAFVRGEVPTSSLPAVLYRDPDNPVDSNAIEVHVPIIGRNARIGFVPNPNGEGLASKLAPTIDRGDVWDALVLNVLVAPGHEDNPGIELRIERISIADAAPTTDTNAPA